MRSSMTFFEVIDKIREVGDIPTLPTIAMKLLSLMADSDANLSEMASIIKTDQALTARVLKVINSPLYGLRDPISSITRAIVLLGINEVRNITVGLSVIKAFPPRPGMARFDRGAFWNHSLSTGQLAQAMEAHLGYNFDGDAYTAGLVHDIGKVILDQYFNEQFIDAIQESRDKIQPLYEAEAKMIGGTHAQIGAWLVKRWRLPKTIQDAVAFHHEPYSVAENRIITALVYMANIVAQSKGLGFGGNVFRVPLDSNDGWKIIQEERPEYEAVPFESFVNELDEAIEKIRLSGSIFVAD